MSTESINQAIAQANDLPERLATALRSARPSGDARIRMSPELSYGRHAGPPPLTARAAAVILLIFQREGQWFVPLTERPLTLSRHAGQFSLPGGTVDPGESSREAALRELEEELGIASAVEILGRLADCYVFASDFLITPWVAATRANPVWRPHDREVQGVVELSLETLLDDLSIDQMTIQRGPLSFTAPCIRIADATVWGATSVILSELAEVLRAIPSLQQQVSRRGAEGAE